MPVMNPWRPVAWRTPARWRTSSCPSLQRARTLAHRSSTGSPGRESCSPDRTSVFTVEQRDALRERLLRLAEEDERVVAGALVGSLAGDGGDRYSDLDLTFGIADRVLVNDVLNDWTRTLVDELDAVHLGDLEPGPTTYRVFLLPHELQCDL